MPLLLYSYLLAEIAAPFLASLTILTAIMFLGRLLQIFDTVFALGIGPADFLRLVLYILPKLMMFSLPLASMFGVILCFGRLGADNELLALRAGGTGPVKLIPPVLFFALLVATVAGYFSMILMPHGLVNMKLLMVKLAQDKVDRGVRAGRFSDSLGGVVIYVDHIDRSSGQWQTVYIHDGREKGHPVIVTASGGNLRADYAHLELVLNLEQGALETGSAAKMQYVSFRHYALSLPVPMITKGHSSQGHEEMSQYQLRKIVQQEGVDSHNAIEAYIEYQRRWVLAVGCFILTMLGLPLGARTAPGRKQTAVPIAIACFVAYYVLFSYSEGLAEQGGRYLWALLWLPNGVFALLTIGQLALMGRESQGRLEALVTRLGQIFQGRAAWRNKP